MAEGGWRTWSSARVAGGLQSARADGSGAQVAACPDALAAGGRCATVGGRPAAGSGAAPRRRPLLGLRVAVASREGGLVAAGEQRGLRGQKGVKGCGLVLQTGGAHGLPQAQAGK